MMRLFFKGFAGALLFFSLLGLAWLLILRPGMTAHEAMDLKAEYVAQGPGAVGSGALPTGKEQPLDFAALQREWPDIRAWLVIPGTCVDYPVLQSSPQQPEYYLRRNYKGEWRTAGSLFFQAGCRMDDRNLVVFGHNMSDGTMLGCLSEYMKEAFRKAHAQLILQTVDATKTYSVIAVFETGGSNPPVNRTVFADDADFLAFEESLLRRSLFESGHLCKPQDRLLTLITCSDAGTDARLVVVAAQN